MKGLGQLEQFILQLPATEVEVDDVPPLYWDNWGSLLGRVEELGRLIAAKREEKEALPKGNTRRRLAFQGVALKKEQNRLQAKIKGKTERVRLAFNQLFLTGMVKAYDYHGGPPYSFEEMRTNAIANWEGFKNTEILRRSEMEPWLREFYKPRAEFVCVGSGLAMSVWPERIIKPVLGQLRLSL